METIIDSHAPTPLTHAERRVSNMSVCVREWKESGWGARVDLWLNFSIHCPPQPLCMAGGGYSSLIPLTIPSIPPYSSISSPKGPASRAGT